MCLALYLLVVLNVSQVRTLIHDYITDEEQGSVSGRNPISSINEILREGKFTRDKTKAPLHPISNFSYLLYDI